MNIKKPIPYSRQNIIKKDIDEVVKVLKSDFITQGNKNMELEKAICNFTSAKFSISVNSATSALHLSCLALGLGKDDLLWTSPISFVSSANCALMCNSNIDFVDINNKTINIDLLELEKKLKNAKKNNKIPKIIVVVHMAGLPCDMKKIKKLSNIYKFKIIEDASHAVNAYYNNQIIGNCRYSDITIFSFHAVKIITSGEGGIALTNNKILANKIKLLRSHGITREYSLFKKKHIQKWYYEQQLLGYNFRLTEFQSALVISQLRRIKSITKKRYKLFNLYNLLLKKLPLILPPNFINFKSSMHLYIIQLNFKNSENKRDLIFNFLIEKNILVNLHYIPIHLQPYYRNLGFKEGDFPIAEKYFKNSLTLPLYPDLKEKELKYIVNNLKLALQKFS